MPVEVTHPPLRILYAALAHDYGDRARGRSFEHWNFYDSLRRMGHALVYFDYMSVMRELGKEGMNRALFDLVLSEKPDLFFSILFNDELEPATIDRITRETNTVTMTWFCDDHWRFDGFSRHYAPAFDWCVTTARSALPKYAALGYERVIKSQWACNHFHYTPSAHPPAYDITFLGMAHGFRPQVIERLVQAGLDVGVWGTGWPAGRLPQAQIIEVFGRSRVNLNLSNASTPTQDGLAQQVKGRNFEIPACRGFQLSGVAEDLDSYLRIGQEIVCYETVDELVDRARYYLGHDEERDAIAQAGYERVLAEHTYVHRFNEIFGRVIAEDPKAAHWTQKEPPTSSRPKRPASLKNAKIGYPTTSILILNFNGIAHIENCLNSIRRYTDVPHELLLVDNASTDGSREILRTADFDNLTLVENPENLGCPPARAQGLALAKGDYCLFLDNDTIVTPGWLRRLIEHCEDNPSLGIVGPRSNYVSGAQYLPGADYKDLPGLERFAEAIAHKHRGALTPTHRLIGFCMFFRREVVERIGTCDARFGKYGFEDDDFTWRAILAGFEAAIAHDVFIHHVGSQGSKAGNLDYNRLVAEAWSAFRAKWRLPSTLSFRQYVELSHEYGLVRRFDRERDYIPLPDAATLEPLMTRRPRT
jgi:spore maturation protein CgeB